jgi:hypothetical protein
LAHERIAEQVGEVCILAHVSCRFPRQQDLVATQSDISSERWMISM